MVEVPRSMKKMAIAVMAISSVLIGTACSAGGATPGNDAPQLSQSAEDFLTKEGKALNTPSISVLVQSSPQATAIQEISDQFTSLTGIKVNWTVLDEQSVENKAAVALGSGNGGYDVIQTPSAFIPTYVERGWIESLDDLASNQKLLVPGWSKDAFGSGLNNLLTQKGELYGAPMFIGTQNYYYRTDLFKKAGITKTPTTFEELIADVKKVNSDEVAGIALRSAPSVSQLLFVWSAWLYAYGGSYYKDYSDGTYSGSALNSPEAVKALEDYTDLLTNYAPSGATNWAVDDVTRAFTSGRVAIVQEGAVFGGTFNNPDLSQVAGKVGTFTIPAGPAGTFVPYNDHGWTIASNSKAKDAAWLFVQWATLKQTLTTATQGKANFSTPPISAVYTSDEYQKKYAFDDYIDTVTKTIDIANNGGISPLKGDPNYQPGNSAWATNGQRIAEELSKAVTGQESAADAIAQAATYLK